MCLQLRQWALNTTPARLLRLVQVLVLCVGTELFWGGRRVGAELAGRVSHGSAVPFNPLDAPIVGTTRFPARGPRGQFLLAKPQCLVPVMLRVSGPKPVWEHEGPIKSLPVLLSTQTCYMPLSRIAGVAAHLCP